jgi:lipid-binding SYLF domain-containing protein
MYPVERNKMKLRFAVRAVVAALVIFLLPHASLAAGKEAEKVVEAANVLEQIMAIPESAIPPSLLQNAYGIAIVPGVIKAGFFIGGRYGTGVVCVRNAAGTWSNPSFVSLAGGSFGWQVGAQSTDVILVFKTPRSIEGIMKGKFTLGADAAVAAGPVGRRVEGATDVALKAEILSYSRTRGFFAGVSLEGSALQMDDEANAAFYGRSDVRPEDIFNNRGIVAPESALRLRQALATYAH